METFWTIWRAKNYCMGSVSIKDEWIGEETYERNAIK